MLFHKSVSVYDGIINNKDTRNKNKMDIPGYRTAAGQRTFYYRAVSLWNNLPGSLTEVSNLALFRKELMHHSFTKRMFEAFNEFNIVQISC